MPDPPISIFLAGFFFYHGRKKKALVAVWLRQVVYPDLGMRFFDQMTQFLSGYGSQ